MPLGFAQKEALWIGVAAPEADSVGSWSCFRQDVTLENRPSEALAQICADSKYWLWINGELVVYEGNLKRGESPGSSYYDEVDIAGNLKRGRNTVAVLVWHFGQSGFSHVDSGKSGLYFSCPAIGLVSDASWRACLHPAYSVCGEPYANFRLPEPNIRFDERLNIEGWQESGLDSPAFSPVCTYGLKDAEPWGRMVRRPIPQWKDFGVKKVRKLDIEKLGNGFVRVTAVLPYNMQMNPVIEVEDRIGGSLVDIRTDHSVSGSEVNSRAEYVTAPGVHRYESFGWLTAERIILTVPENVRIKSIGYRQTGYETSPSGRFECSDGFICRFWEKALNTLYINMRDTFYDCPDRERAQWWGDITTMMGECFYTYDLNVHCLLRKAMRELCLWATPDGRLHAPVPGNYEMELPDQMLASVGLYGFWTYYMNTGDEDMIRFVYPYVRKYLSVFSLDSDGLLEMRGGRDVWNWGDWGDDIDKKLIFSAWYSLALESASKMAPLAGFPEDVPGYRVLSERISDGFETCWNGHYYRHPSHVGRVDDRVQALAVVSGIAGPDKYEAIFETFRNEENASPYMEKYVMEALFKMGHGGYAVERFKRRFANMVNDPVHTTLFEGWDEGNIKYGGGTVNHAWSGGPLTVISSSLCGIRPLKPGFRSFSISPEFGILEDWSISFDTVSGRISSSCVEDGKGWKIKVSVPEGTDAVLCLPDGNVAIKGHGFKSIGFNPRTGRSEFLLPAGRYSVEFVRDSRKVVAVRDFGIVPDTGTDIVPALVSILEELRGSSAPVELRFERGRYDIYAPAASDATFSYALKLDGFQNLSIDGGGASFICHGPMRVMTFTGCSNVSLHNMSFDWERPLVSQGTVTGQGKGFLDVSFDKSAYPYRIENGRALFYGDGWESDVVPDSYSTLYSPDGHILPMTEDMYLSAGNALFRGRAEEVAPGVVRFYGDCGNSVPEGCGIVLYHGRYLGGIFTFLGCDGVEVRDVTINHSSGMGILAQLCSDVDIRRVCVVPSVGRYFSSVADAVHINLCSGKVNVGDCVFDGQGDDALNVHGRYHIIDSVSADRRSMVVSSKLGSFSDAPREGDRIWTVNSGMQRCSKNTVDSFELRGDTSAVLHLRASLPGEVIPDMCIENASRFPAVCVERCIFGGGNRARGILLTTPGRTVVRDNVFRSSGAAVLIAGDTDNWYESGAVRDVDIRDNLFEGCAVSSRDSSGHSDWGPAPISITPSFHPSEKNAPLYHHGIKIIGNTFRIATMSVLYARGVDGLIFKDNDISVLPAASNVLDRQPSPIFLENCRNVFIR